MNEEAGLDGCEAGDATYEFQVVVDVNLNGADEDQIRAAIEEALYNLYPDLVIPQTDATVANITVS